MVRKTMIDFVLRMTLPGLIKRCCEAVGVVVEGGWLGSGIVTLLVMEGQGAQGQVAVDR